MPLPDLFDLVYEAQIDLYKTYIANVMNTLAFIIIAIGWMLTSEKCRGYLSENRLANRLSLIAVLIVAIIHSLVSIFMYMMSQEKACLLNKLNYIDCKYYEHYIISPAQMIASLLLNLTMLALLFMIILTLHRSKPKVQAVTP
jgi:hypothetical protein